MSPFRRPLAIALLLLSAPFAANAGDGDEPASSVSWEISAVSDYLFRGVSQTDEKATVQGSLTWTAASGVYVGSFASGVDFGTDSPDVEVDYFVGYGFDVSDKVNIDLLLNRYTYPGASEMAYNELVTTTTFADSWALNVSYTNDVWGSGTDGWYYGLSHDWSLPNDFTLSANVGRSVFRDSAVAEDYTDWGVGISRSFGPANVSLGYYGVDGKGRDNFGNLADSRVLLTVKFAR
jgi:uncharacterized protein (TIGR02001 family)